MSPTALFAPHLPNDRLPRQSLRAWKHVLPFPLTATGAASTEPRGCKSGRNNHPCQSPFLSRGQTKGTPPCSPPRGEVCGGNHETPHCDPGSSAEFPTLGSGGGVGGVEERDRQKGKDRDSQKDRERGDKPRGRISARARSKGRRLRGEGAGVETAWPHESDILRAFCSAKITRINPNFIHCVP